MAETNLHQRRPHGGANGNAGYGGGGYGGGGYGGAPSPYGQQPATAAASPYGAGSSSYGAASPSSGGYNAGNAAATPTPMGGYGYGGGGGYGTSSTSSSSTSTPFGAAMSPSKTKRRGGKPYAGGGLSPDTGGMSMAYYVMGFVLLLLIGGFIMTASRLSSLKSTLSKIQSDKSTAEASLSQLQKRLSEKRKEYDQIFGELVTIRKEERAATQQYNEEQRNHNKAKKQENTSIIQRLQKENEFLHKQLAQLEEDLEMHHEEYHGEYTFDERQARVKAQQERHRSAVSNATSSVEKLQDKIETRAVGLDGRLRKLREYVQIDARREVMEKYGPGPHHVKLYVQLPSQPSPQPITIEMAPLDLMPHTVHVFLEQISHKLWEKCSFVINQSHVLQASAVPSNPSQSARNMLMPFQNLHLSSVSFQEYSSEYPHDQWTLGYAGRPGGPDFYINIQENRVAHGPGGQAAHDQNADEVEKLMQEADPAFAKVVDGFDVIQRMQKVETDPQTNMFTQRIVIDKVEIVGWDGDGWDYYKNAGQQGGGEDVNVAMGSAGGGAAAA